MTDLRPRPLRPLSAPDEAALPASVFRADLSGFGQLYLMGDGRPRGVIRITADYLGPGSVNYVALSVDPSGIQFKRDDPERLFSHPP